MGRALLITILSRAGLSSLAGALMLAGLIWLFSPALLAFDSVALRLCLALAPVVICLAALAFLARRRRRRDEALVAGVAATTSAPSADDGADEQMAAAEQAAVARQLQEALGALKRGAGKRGEFLYQRPWYVIIGPPGAGKTTAIQASGLEFPVEAGRVRGVGGTRNCDWWISDDAVLIDTAGRYTTQDSDAKADRAGWEGFLALLRKERPLQPLNGVIVAFGVDMLSRMEPPERESHARAVRARIRELEDKLEQSLPVYLLVSKADLLVGFTEFFDDLNREGRDQVWGMTFPAERQVAGPVWLFGPEFAKLIARLNARLFERLQNERGPEQRTRIAGFAAQFASLEPVLAPFLKSAFGGSPLEPAPFLRGVYFTSGTQEGTPIDRLLGAFSKTFGLDMRPPPSVAQRSAKSYFLGRLLREVVFNEAQLAARDRARARRRLALRSAAWVLAAALVGLGAFGGWSIAKTEAARSERFAQQLQSAEAASRGLGFDPAPAQEPLAPVVTYLDKIHDLRAAAGEPGMHFGLGQREKLAQVAQVAYGRALDRVLLPRAVARLEAQIRAAMQRPDFLYEATRVYLMLTRQGPLDRGLVADWLRLDHEQALPGAINAPVRDRLAAHVSALLGQSLAQIEPDRALVEQARIVFSKLPLAQRVYGRVRARAGALPPWRAVEALGRAGGRFFTRANGRPIDDLVVPGFFTVSGRKALQAALPLAIAEAAAESWVFGEQTSSVLRADPRQLESAIMRLYADEYARSWEAFLGDINVVPFRTLQQAADALNILSAPNSPIRELLRSAVAQLAPDADDAAHAAVARPDLRSAPGGDLAAPNAAAGAAQRLAAVVGAGAQTSPLTQVLDARFKALRDAAGQPLDQELAVLADLYGAIARGPQSPAAGPDPGQRLASDAQRLPPPLSRWAAAVAQSVNTLRSGTIKASINAAAATRLTPFCRRVETRFPFARDPAAPDMPLDDFVRLFGPGGSFDAFFDQNLKQYADTSRKPWRPTAGDAATPPVAAADLAQFQRAAAIRDAFFPSGGGASSTLRFELIPLGADSAGKGATLEAEGAKTLINAGPGLARPVQLQWPSKQPVTLTFDPPPPGGAIVGDGPWAALRFVAHGRLAPSTSPDRARLTIRRGERSADFELRTGSVVNPFGLRELSEFRCPQFAP